MLLIHVFFFFCILTRTLDEMRIKIRIVTSFHFLLLTFLFFFSPNKFYSELSNLRDRETFFFRRSTHERLVRIAAELCCFVKFAEFRVCLRVSLLHTLLPAQKKKLFSYMLDYVSSFLFLVYFVLLLKMFRLLNFIFFRAFDARPMAGGEKKKKKKKLASMAVRYTSIMDVITGCRYISKRYNLKYTSSRIRRLFHHFCIRGRVGNCKNLKKQPHKRNACRIWEQFFFYFWNPSVISWLENRGTKIHIAWLDLRLCVHICVNLNLMPKLCESQKLVTRIFEREDLGFVTKEQK